MDYGYGSTQRAHHQRSEQEFSSPVEVGDYCSSGLLYMLLAGDTVTASGVHLHPWKGELVGTDDWKFVFFLQSGMSSRAANEALLTVQQSPDSLSMDEGVATKEKN